MVNRLPVLTEDGIEIGQARDEQEAWSVLQEVYTRQEGRRVATAVLRNGCWMPGVVWDAEPLPSYP